MLALAPTSWSPDGGQPDAEYGRSVATAGDVNGDGYSDVLVGAPAYDDGQVDEGRVFLYLGSPTGPDETPDWMFSDDFPGGRFGEELKCQVAYFRHRDRKTNRLITDAFGRVNIGFLDGHVATLRHDELADFEKVKSTFVAMWSPIDRQLD